MATAEAVQPVATSRRRRPAAKAAAPKAVTSLRKEGRQAGGNPPEKAAENWPARESGRKEVQQALRPPEKAVEKKTANRRRLPEKPVEGKAGGGVAGRRPKKAGKKGCRRNRPPRKAGEEVAADKAPVKRDKPAESGILG